MMNDVIPSQADLDYARIEKAITWLNDHAMEQPELAAVARAVHLSEFHFQRLFTRWAGISPKRFLQFVTIERAKQQLAESRPLLETALNSGLSGPGRLHDLFVAMEAATPGEFKTRGAGIRIQCGFHATPFGRCLIGSTGRGVCWLSFTNRHGDRESLRELEKHWSGAEISADARGTQAIAERLFSRSKGRAGESKPGVLVMGTNFQIKVWQALLRIPQGTVTSYESIGESIGALNSSRAIGAAVGQNAIAFLIPCHRVIRKTGLLGGYRWGESRKRAMLGWEAARSAAL
jgi:AraC family transcriptional regulator of adaptative response/methylated-DNA-[protein]-cysteine methyltransferase